MKKQTVDFGTVDFDGQTIQLTQEAWITSRLLPDHLAGHFEMKASGVDAEGNEVEVFWVFEDIEGWELDAYDYDDVDRLQSV